MAFVLWESNCCNHFSRSYWPWRDPLGWHYCQKCKNRIWAQTQDTKYGRISSLVLLNEKHKESKLVVAMSKHANRKQIQIYARQFKSTVIIQSPPTKRKRILQAGEIKQAGQKPKTTVDIHITRRKGCILWLPHHLWQTQNWSTDCVYCNILLTQSSLIVLCICMLSLSLPIHFYLWSCL